MYGTIALDIDGTITADSRQHTMPPRVVRYLTKLAQEGWQLFFITGRAFGSGYQILKGLPFNYYLAVQNGAIILEMPTQRIISKKYLDRSILCTMDTICHENPSDFVVCSGIEHQDIFYYRPKRFSAPLLSYLEERICSFKEIWRPLDSFHEMQINEFPSIKCFGQYEGALEITRKIEAALGLHVPLIRDPFDESYYVVQATHPEISKGQALHDLLAITGRCGKVIAAGDDHNDYSMLAAADIKIAMHTSPPELLKIADIVAPPANAEGIIIGLEAAIKQW